MKKVICVSIAGLALACLVSTTTNARGGHQPVYSFKNLGEFENSKGEEFTKLLVTCNGGLEPRYIQRIVGQKLWCIDGMPESCSEERIESATVACTTKMDVLKAAATVANAEPEAQQTQQEDPQKAALRKKLLAEQMEVEQKRLDIETRRVQLREQELKLLSARGN